MSLNRLITNTNDIELLVFIKLLEEYITQWQSASTLESRAAVEANALALYDKISNKELSLREVKVGEIPYTEEISECYKEYVALMKVNFERLRLLIQSFLNEFTNENINLFQLESQYRAVKQKQSAIELWNKDFKYVVSFSFYNLQQIADYSGFGLLNINTNESIVTLPVKSEQILKINNIVIGKDSNGQSGSRNLSIDSSTMNPKELLRGNLFEFSRLNSGPCKLSLILSLDKKSIINQIRISSGKGLQFRIKDIFLDNVNVKEISPSYPESYWFVGSSGKTWSISCLPTYAETITITFEQSNYSEVSIYNPQNEIVQAKEFLISLSEISLLSKQYYSEGKLDSKIIDISDNLFVADIDFQTFPVDNKFYNLNLFTKFSASDTFSEVVLDSKFDAQTVLLSEESDIVQWKLSLVRDDAAINTSDSFVENQNVKYNFISRTASKGYSPLNVELTEKFYKDLFVFQPQVFSRSIKNRYITLGSGDNISSSFRLPVNILDFKIDPLEGNVYVGNNLLTYNMFGDSLIAGEWTYSADFNSILLGEVADTGQVVKFILNPQELNFEERQDGFYAELTGLFDPDIENISVIYIPRLTKNVTHTVDRDKIVIQLMGAPIDSTSFQIKSSNSISYTSVANRSDLEEVSNRYYLDAVNGILWLSNPLGSDVVSLNYNYFDKEIISNKYIDVVWENGLPWGLKIHKNHFSSLVGRDVVGSGPGPRLNLVSNTYTALQDYFTSSTTTLQLSEHNIIKNSVVVEETFLGTSDAPEEVLFINGRDEFLGLTTITNEFTVETLASSNIVSFYLSAGALWYDEWKPVFSTNSVFTTYVNSLAAVNSIGKWYVDEYGLVSVYIGTGNTLPSGINIYYYYQDPEFEPDNKFSVDYINGIVYSYRAMSEGAIIIYKAANYIACYDLVLQIPSSLLTNKNISLRTDKLIDVNNQYKIVWGSSLNSQNLVELKDYFSPLISNITYRFN